MENNYPIGWPKAQGLYNPANEHDACGVGFIVHQKGQKSHSIIRNALTILCNLTHRGATGAEPNSGDGAGILSQIPHSFFVKVAKDRRWELPAAGQYAVGMFFLPPDPTAQQKCQQIVNALIHQEGQQLIGWRDVPANNTTLGKTAIQCQPTIKQVVVAKDDSISDENEFERILYIIRRQAEQQIRFATAPFPGSHYFYVASFSCRTIVYKGMLTSQQVDEFYADLSDPLFESALALVHSRFSTNTFPSWERAHPNRYIIHNGEINTLRGNVNWFKAREHLMESQAFGENLTKTFPVIHEDGSDSSMFDNCFEFLALAGKSMAEAAMMMIPEPWAKHKQMSAEKKAFYEFYSCHMEPWDGPASVAFTDGIQVGAILDRNGLRPSRYVVTKDDLVILASEVGVLDIPAENIIEKSRLQPGRMLLIDTQKGTIISDDDIKSDIAQKRPYGKWLKKHLIHLNKLSIPIEFKYIRPENLTQLQKAFGYTLEEVNLIVRDMVATKVDPVGSMGNDTPLAVLSDHPKLLYSYFRQLFAQVTNPPIDAIREELVTSSVSMLGGSGNILHPKPESCHRLKLETPIVTEADVAKIRSVNIDGIRCKTIPLLYNAGGNGRVLERALDQLFVDVDQAVQQGCNILILSDKGVNGEKACIPALLACAGLHHHLIRNRLRSETSIILESGEPRAIHQFALLIGYGVDAVCPYLALETIIGLCEDQVFESPISVEDAQAMYLKVATKGVIKVISKMGISTIQSYCGAQIFECIGIAKAVVDKYFTNTPSRIGGIDLEIIAKEVLLRHEKAYPKIEPIEYLLDSGGEFKWRHNQEYHAINPKLIHKLQYACRTNDYAAYQDYTKIVFDPQDHLCTLRDLLIFKSEPSSISIDEVEPVEAILKRFKTGAMSYGSISKEVHEAIAIAMNRIGAKNNSGEGGEDPARFQKLENGDSKCSAIKQVASGRFGVTSEYLSSAIEIQIKMAQGAKPGEGGQLPGRKVYPWVAKVRYSTPGVGLISPPPHHDIYSIEDLAQLVHDLKNANRQARINVKLVSEVGVGTIAAGVAKGHADVILISGAEGGTGASPRTSIKYAGLPWELGLAETHQTLVLNNLRSRVTLETDGMLKTGRDVVIAACLGAEEFGFGTIPLIVMGCVMMRVCHMDTCPVGVATQNPKLRDCFKGDPAHLANFFRFLAQDIREIMAHLGIKNFNDLIGRTDLLKKNKAIKHWKASTVDVSPLLHQPVTNEEIGRYCQIEQDHGLEQSLDLTSILSVCKPALESKKRVEASFPINNTNRVVGTILGNEVSKRYKGAGLPDNTINLSFKGSAGQSFGAFVPKGITLLLKGDANDYFGKGLSGGHLIVAPPKESIFEPHEQIIIGNVAFYGATSGKAYVNGIAGERFCVRNSGLTAVVEGIGDHGCEYMTGGCAVILGAVGRNFAAGMSGGVAYVYDPNNDFLTQCNLDMVSATNLEQQEDKDLVEALIKEHYSATNSPKAKLILSNWDPSSVQFKKVVPNDYGRMLKMIDEMKAKGLSDDDAKMAAFEANKNDISRVSGN